MAKNNLLTDLIKITENPFAALASEGIPGSEVTEWIDTGSYAFNALLSGSMHKGLAGNKILALAGPSAVGKTWFAFSLIKSFLEKHSDAICIYFDSESAITADMFKHRGIPPERVALISIDTIQNFRTQCVKIVDAYMKLPESQKKPIIICLDSLGNLSTNKEIGDISEGKDIQDMTRTKLIKGAFRVLTQKLGVAGIPMILTNHTYQTQELYSQMVMSGGTGLQYSSSTTVFLTKRKEKEGKEIVGNVIHCKLNKARHTKENSMVDVLLRYDTGLNKYYGLLPIAEKYSIFKKSGNKYEMPDGTKAFESQINSNPEKYYTKEVMEKLEEAVYAEFNYGLSSASIASTTEIDEEQSENGDEE
jgi:RecA/RadA recombinase